MYIWTTLRSHASSFFLLYFLPLPHCGCLLNAINPCRLCGLAEAALGILRKGTFPMHLDSFFNLLSHVRLRSGKGDNCMHVSDFEF